jgi:hypothetical protein
MTITMASFKPISGVENIHHIHRSTGRTSETIFTTLSKLNALYKHVTNPNLNEYKLTAIVLDTAGHKLFTCVGIKKDERDKPSFQKLSFANKGFDGINLGLDYISMGNMHRCNQET